MEKTHYGFESQAISSGDPPYVVSKVTIAYSGDPDDLWVSTGSRDMVYVVKCGPKVYFCGYDEQRTAQWSKEKEASVTFADDLSARIAMHHLEDHDTP